MSTKLQEVMNELKSLGDEKIKKILVKHGIQEPFFGVKVGDLKPIQKRIKKDYGFAKELYNTGNADAMYLAGLIADDEKMTTSDLQDWVKKAVSNNISEYTVPWVAAEGKHGFEMALNWIGAKEEHIAAAGWATLSNILALKPDSELDIDVIKKLLTGIPGVIHTVPDRVRLKMNSFIIAAGTYVKALTPDALAVAKKTGLVKANMHGTACKVPDATVYLAKAKEAGSIGKKKKTVKC